MVLKESAAGFILGGLIAVAGIWFIVAGVRENAEIGRMSAKVSGTVLSGSVESHSARRSTINNYFLTVMYTVDANLYTEKIQVEKDAYDKYRSGGQVEVLYDPADPKMADLAGISARSTTSLFVRGIVILLVGAGFILYGLKARKKAPPELMPAEA